MITAVLLESGERVRAAACMVEYTDQARMRPFCPQLKVKPVEYGWDELQCLLCKQLMGLTVNEDPIGALVRAFILWMSTTRVSVNRASPKTPECRTQVSLVQGWVIARLTALCSSSFRYFSRHSTIGDYFVILVSA